MRFQSIRSPSDAKRHKRRKGQVEEVPATGTVKTVDRKNRKVERTVKREMFEEIDWSKVKAGGTAEAVYVTSYAIQVFPCPKRRGICTSPEFSHGSRMLAQDSRGWTPLWRETDSDSYQLSDFAVRE